MDTWLLFTYKVPNEPSARRVYVWRKLKAMGGILVHDSVWMLPANDRTREKLQWLGSEVKDMDGGEAMLWEAKQMFTGGDVDLAAQFTSQVDELYAKIMQALKKKNPDLEALSRQYQQANTQDYFESELGRKVRAALLERGRNNQT